MPRRGENIRKRKDGRWEGRYKKEQDLYSKTKYGSVYGKTYSEVKQKLQDISLAKMNNTYITKKTNVYYKDILYMWLDNSKVKLKEQSYTKYYHLITKHIVPYIGDIKINNIDALYINKFLYQKFSKGRLSEEGNLSPNYVRTIGYILKTSLNYAAENRYCAPITGKIHIPSLPKKKLEVFSIGEQMSLEKICLAQKNSKRLGVLISLHTGLRIGEVCGLKWGDINFQEKTLHIQRTVERISVIHSTDSSKTKLILSNTKSNASNRIIPLPNPLISILSELKKEDEQFIIKGKRNPYIDPRSLQYYYKSLLEKNNIRYLNFHCLRHTFATRCIESGMDVKSLSEILGHSDVNITLNTYVHSSLEHKRNQIDVLVKYIYGH